MLVLFFSHLCTQAGDLDVKISIAPGKEVKINGFRGLKELKITDLVLDKNGFAKFSGDYLGFLLLEIENTGTFPVIMNDEPITFTLDETGIPAFIDPENIWLYDALANQKKLDRQNRVLQENLSFFSCNDPFHLIIMNKLKEMDNARRDYEKQISGEHNWMAAMLLQGQLIIEKTYGVRTNEELTKQKKVMLDFLSNNYTKLYHSDMFRQMAFQYAMMNEYVAQSREEHYSYVLSDINDWIAAFKGRLTPEEITVFFIEMAVGRRMISLANMIREKYPESSGDTGK